MSIRHRMEYNPHMKRTAKQLTANDWLDHALQVLSQQGLAAVAVEPLAKSLGVTKGSFYWHFSNRQQLINDLLVFWENIELDYQQDLLKADLEPQPLFQQLLALLIDDDTNKGVFLAVAGQSDKEEIKPFYQRAVERRLGLFCEIFKRAGSTTKQARQQAAQVYLAYSGMIKAVVDQSLPETYCLTTSQFIKAQCSVYFTKAG